MKPIEIDFAGDKHLRARWVLASTLLLLVAMVSMQLKVRGDRLESTRAEMYASADLLPEDRPAPRAHRIQLPAEAIAELDTPWDVLINSLDKANANGIGVTSITPNPATRTLTLNGEAESFDALRNYLVSLENGGMRHAALDSESMSEVNSKIIFQISASWPESQPGATSP